MAIKLLGGLRYCRATLMRAICLHDFSVQVSSICADTPTQSEKKNSKITRTYNILMWFVTIFIAVITFYCSLQAYILGDEYVWVYPGTLQMSKYFTTFFFCGWFTMTHKTMTHKRAEYAFQTLTTLLGSLGNHFSTNSKFNRQVFGKFHLKSLVDPHNQINFCYPFHMNS